MVFYKARISNIIKIYFLKDILYSASQNGHLEVLKFLYTIKPEHYDSFAMNYAAENGHLDIIMWLYSIGKGYNSNNRAIDYAAKNGHLEIVKWLHNKGYKYRHAVYYASQNGHQEIVDYFALCNKAKN